MKRLAASRQAWLALAAAAMSLAVHAQGLDAQTMRDPTVPPAAARPAAATPNAPGGVTAPPSTPKHLVRIDGVPYVVEGTRRRGVGDLRQRHPDPASRSGRQAGRGGVSRRRI